jgi:hypothetical protein
MSSREQTPLATKVRVVLQPLKTQKPEGLPPEKQSSEMKKRKRAEEEEKEIKQETRLVFDTTRPSSEITRPVPDIVVQAGDVEKKVMVLPLPYQKDKQGADRNNNAVFQGHEKN